MERGRVRSWYSSQLFFVAAAVAALRQLLFFAPLLLPLRRCSYRFFAPQGTHRKKLMPARFTAQRWNTQQPSEESHHAWHMLRRNALQFEIAADPAMRVNNVAER
jgi:hypothetical protein